MWNLLFATRSKPVGSWARPVKDTHIIGRGLLYCGCKEIERERETGNTEIQEHQYMSIADSWTTVCGAIRLGWCLAEG